MNRNQLAGSFTGIGVELGVARGHYSKIILAHGIVERLYSIDRWSGDRGHGFNQYAETFHALKPYTRRNTIIRSTFHEALSLFDDDFFDFIYIDGYAHAGQEQGTTLYEWWPKLKDGGMFSGHDYAEKYPETISAVDKFSKEKERPFNLTDGDRFASWYMSK